MTDEVPGERFIYCYIWEGWGECSCGGITGGRPGPPPDYALREYCVCNDPERDCDAHLVPYGGEHGYPPGDGLRERITEALAVHDCKWLGGKPSSKGDAQWAVWRDAADAVMAVVQPYLDQITGLSESFRVADGHTDRAEAELARVRRIHTHGPRTNTCNEDGANWPCDTIRAIEERRPRRTSDYPR